ncbi:MAG TPA: DUF5946 family protein [Acidobacteriaceae bacterium]|nr:DUF5946 family protein [Acidobacteriaceae bacterium]
MPTDQELFDELSFYTLAHGDSAFIHENSADAYRAQHVDDTTKPMAVVFAVMGLYLYLEKNFTGRQVQLAHMRMARHRKEWPRVPIPKEQASLTVADVLTAEPGPARDARIRDWCAAVWEIWQESRPQIVALAKAELGVD